MGERMGENVMEVLRGTLIEIDSVEILDSKTNKEDTGMYVVKTPGEIDFNSNKGDMLMIEIAERIREMFILYEVICTENGLCKQTRYIFKDWETGNELYYGDMYREFQFFDTISNISTYSRELTKTVELFPRTEITHKNHARPIPANEQN